MLIIISGKSKSVVEWPSIEGFSLNELAYNQELVVTTKSGSALRIINPTRRGEDVDFQSLMNWWLEGQMLLEITEGKDKSPIPQGVPPQMHRPPELFNCKLCNTELEFGECSNPFCESNEK